MSKSRSFRVAEIFGPTIQGEGRNVGMPCHFVRFGGCDFRCSWCDTPHAVLPDQVNKLPQMSEWQILDAVHRLDKGENDAFIRWVVLSGGNPGLLNLDYLIELLHTRAYKVMVETQGSTYRPWFAQVDDLCISPKPPSSGMEYDVIFLDKMISKLFEDDPMRSPYLKIPIFSDADLDFAEMIHRQFNLELFLSIGNTDPYLPTVGNPDPGLRDAAVEHRVTSVLVLANFRKVLEKILATRPALQDCQIFPQQHTLLWGNERGR